MMADELMAKLGEQRATASIPKQPTLKLAPKQILNCLRKLALLLLFPLLTCKIRQAEHKYQPSNWSRKSKHQFACLVTHWNGKGYYVECENAASLAWSQNWKFATASGLNTDEQKLERPQVRKMVEGISLAQFLHQLLAFAY